MKTVFAISTNCKTERVLIRKQLEKKWQQAQAARKSRLQSIFFDKDIDEKTQKSTNAEEENQTKDELLV